MLSSHFYTQTELTTVTYIQIYNTIQNEMKPNEGRVNLRQMDVIRNMKLASCEEHARNMTRDENLKFTFQTS